MGEDNIELSDFDNELYSAHFHVTIFESPGMEKDETRFKEIYELSKMIARENINIVTGGGFGIMHTASRGAMDGRENESVHSLGLNIKLPWEQEANRHLDLKQNFNRFSNRLDTFMFLSNVVVVTPGGVGTFLKVLYRWQLVQVEHICDVPFILLGEMWKGFIEWIKKDSLKKRLLNKTDLDNIFYVQSITEAFSLIKEFHDAFKQGKKYTYLNFRRYQAKKKE